MQPVSLALIEDHPLLREVLSGYLHAQPEFRLVLVADSVEAFLANLAAAPEAPQIVLSDIGLPGVSGIAGLPLILARLPDAQVLMLSVFAEAEYVYQALCAGAVGYLLKDTPLAELKEHLLAVAAGGSPMSPGLARYVVRAFQRLAAPPVPTPPREAEHLTPRELEVARGIEDGLSYQRIADRHCISIDTVRTHIRTMYRKLHVNSKGELLARALRQRP